MIPYITGTKALKTKTAPTRSEYWPTIRTGGHQARMTAEANNRTVENQPVMANGKAYLVTDLLSGNIPVKKMKHSGYMQIR
jgi:hypothetical protein